MKAEDKWLVAVLAFSLLFIASFSIGVWG